MRIDSLKIKNYRNIEKCEVSFLHKNVLFYGLNAQGKTNILESIYFLNFFKSFRTANTSDLVKSGQEYFNIESRIDNLTKNKLKVVCNKSNKKKVLLNEKSPEPLEIYRIINSIIYYPSEINYLCLYPVYRRNLIDRSIFLIENDYVVNIKKYNKLLKQRNSYLKNYNNNYDPWVDLFVEQSVYISNKRNQYLKRINNILSSFDNKEDFQLEYASDTDRLNRDHYIDKYNKLKSREEKCGYTLFGPHVEDIKFLINGKDIRKFSSEGQKKFFLLYYKLAQILDYKENHNVYPVLLFDDFTSELDKVRKEVVLNNIIENSGQIFFTATDIPEDLPQDCDIFHIDNGVVASHSNQEGI